jgi:hypothetical protein
MSSRMMFLDCPAYLDENTGVRCGFPAEVRCRFIMDSTNGPLESVAIRCPSGHFFNGPIESLCLDLTSVPPESAQVVRAMARKQGFW